MGWDVDNRKRKRDICTVGESRPFRSHPRFQALLERGSSDTEH